MRRRGECLERHDGRALVQGLDHGERAKNGLDRRRHDEFRIAEFAKFARWPSFGKA
jgi:hypothetical protein